MILGEYNTLRLDRFTSVGAYLEDEEGNDVLLPNKFIYPEFELDDQVEVFVYKDHEQRIIATTQHPYIRKNQFAFLKIAQVNEIGAFADWGLEKHLMIPYREQPKKLEEEKRYLVYMYLDDATQRLVATTRIKMYLTDEHSLEKDEEVTALVWDRTELGYKVIVNHKHPAVIYHNSVPTGLRFGETVKAFVKLIREDGKIDLSLQREGYEKIDSLSQELIDLLKKYDGFIDVSDKSSPEDIFAVTKWSKKVFKQTVGNLYKQRLILIGENGISLVQSNDE